MAKGHRGNPASSLHIDKLYAIPVLMSGLCPLVLTDPEITMIDQQHKETLRCLPAQAAPEHTIGGKSVLLSGNALFNGKFSVRILVFF
jgi:hypothetical protein